MAIYKIWFGSVGPILVDSSNQYGDAAIFMHALRTDGPIRIEHTPTDLKHAIRLEDLVIVQDDSYHMVAALTSLDMTNTGTSTIMTAPANAKIVPLRMIVELESVSGSGIVPTVSLGRTGNLTGWIDEEELIGLTNADNVFVSLISGKLPILLGFEALNITVDVAATYTQFYTNVYIYGAKL